MANKHLLIGILIPVLFGWSACTNQTPGSDDPKGTVYYIESDEIFPNPERGFHSQIYYTSGDLKSHASVQKIRNEREGSYKLTLYLHSYYLTNYMTSDIPEEFLQRLDSNMRALRAGGAKAIVRFSYKDNYSEADHPWDASPEWVSRHIDQLAPYLMKNADVIFCIQCGFIGSWGEWYYTDNFNFNPSEDKDFEVRWEMVEHLMNVTPKDRQIALRTPGYKIRYLKMRGMEIAPLTAEEAFQPTIKARWAGHNDCFVASDNDVGTYTNNEYYNERNFWAEDTKYTVMGGETCGECYYSRGDRAIEQMIRYHWTYINRDYHQGVIGDWITKGHIDDIKRRLGYRLVLDKALFSQNNVAGQTFTADIHMRNVGFAAPVNKRDVELIFVSTTNPNDKFVYPQTDIEPRLWMGRESQHILLKCTLDKKMAGTYNVYLNLPDPYPSLHDNPNYSIRLANKDTWEQETGYNKLGEITL